MQKLKLKFRIFYLLHLTISVIISVSIVSIFGFKYLTRLHEQHIRHSKMFIKTHQRMDLLEERLKDKCLKYHKNLEPANL